jgi:hypothetical protein
MPAISEDRGLQTARSRNDRQSGRHGDDTTWTGLDRWAGEFDDVE